MMSLILRAAGRIRNLIPIASPHFGPYADATRGKAGLEIGGPSVPFRLHSCLPVYPEVGSLDNCDFSSSTVWAQHGSEYVFSEKRPAGRTFVCDGSALTPVASDSYDFLLSSHNLEHFANPVKALVEWKRVLRPNGSLLLILPYYLHTFDHRRTPTPVDHMLQDFKDNVGEDDLTHLPEILEKHDLTRDRAAGTPEAFKARSQDNFNNRCLHHHVFDESNIRGLLTALDYKVIRVDRVAPFHLCVLAHV